MSEETERKTPQERPALSREVGAQEARRLKAQRQAKPSIWFGFGMSGLIGWSVTVPTLLGAGLGLWIDKHHPSAHSWTLMLLVIGLVIGCWNAWHWVAKEEKKMRDEQEENDE
jgi:ATP synthase protein I